MEKTIKLFDFPFDFLAALDCKKTNIYVNGNKASEIFYFANHIRVNLEKGGQMRYFPQDKADHETTLTIKG